MDENEDELPDAGDIVRQLAAVMTMVDAMSVLITASSTYRQKCQDDGGFSETASEAMAVAFHSELVKKAFAQAKT